MSATRQVTVLNRLPRMGETVKFYTVAPNILDGLGKNLPVNYYLVELIGPACDCEEKGIGKPRWFSGCPIHGREGVTGSGTDIPREPQGDDSLAQEYVIPPVRVSHEKLLADLTYLLSEEDARIVEAYLLGVSQGGNMNGPDSPG